MPVSLLLQIAIIISHWPALLVGIRALSFSSVLCRKKNFLPLIPSGSTLEPVKEEN